MKDSKKDPMTTGNKGYQQTQSNQPNRGNPQKGSDEGKPAWKPGSEKTQKPERGDDEHQHENKQPVSNPKGEKDSSKGNKPGDTATGTSQEGSTGIEKSTKKSASSDSMGGGASSAGGGSGNVD